MAATDRLLKPEECAMLLVDFQAGLGFGVESMPVQVVLNNAVALARTGAAFKIPVIASTSASRVYSGPLLPGLQEALPSVKAIERKAMNVWEDDVVRNAVVATKRQRLIVAGFLTEGCVSFSALSALKDGFEVFVVADACGGLTPASHDFALRRLEQAGACLTSWIQLLLEFQRDWTRHETYEAARAIVVANGGGYGMGLAYAREMIHPG
ncbi:MAG TPA: hydrolase [Terriglobales bacterium]|nr:hydrolase [Terriglobales bacterium]